MDDTIDAVHERDLLELLTRLGQIESILDGSRLCDICEKVLTLETVGCIFPYEEEVKICCDRILCIQKSIDLVTPLRNLKLGDNKDE